MRIVCISDTHDTKNGRFNIPDGDVLIHAGDMTYHGSVAEIAAFNEWLGKLPHKHKVVVAGNHDWLFQKDPGLAKSLLTNAAYLQDSGTEILGLKFWGSPWQIEFCNWAFNLPDGELKEYWSLIPDDTDVLITHSPPWGIGDFVPKKGPAGCYDLLQRVREIKPQLHVFGHIHAGYGEYDSLGTKFVNAALMNELYRPMNEPIVVDL